VRKAKVVQVNIGLLHFRSQPGAVLSRPGDAGASVDDVLKTGVDAEVERRAGEPFAKTLGEMEFVRLQYKAGGGAMPQNGGALGIPGEDSLGISCQQALGAQVPSYSEEAVGGGKLCGGKLEGVRTQHPVGGEVEATQMLMRPVSARTLFFAPPKV
jgi:hypothetical protein